MCLGTVGAFALAAVQSGLQIASGIAQSRAIRQQGEAAKNYYDYQAKISEQNALLAERTGAAQSRAIQDVQKIRGRQLKTEQAEFRASQSATLAASGVPLSSVTADDISRSTLSKQSIDELTLRYNADIGSYEAITGAQNQAFGFRTQAVGQRYAGVNARNAARVQARNTLLGSAISAISPFASLSFSNFAIPGLGGYGLNTPIGTRNMGTYSRLPGR